MAKPPHAAPAFGQAERSSVLNLFIMHTNLGNAICINASRFIKTLPLLQNPPNGHRPLGGLIMG